MSVSPIDLPRPVIHRDLSVAVASPDAIDARIRSFLGERAGDVEEIIVLSQTRYPDLSTSTRRRLGMSPGQFHLLLRLVIRDTERTLTAESASHSANELRDAVFGGLHEGGILTWTARETQL